MRLRNNVRFLRERRRLNQTELARRALISRVTLALIEREHGYDPHHSVMEKLARALSVGIGELFWAEEEPANGTRGNVLAPRKSARASSH